MTRVVFLPGAGGRRDYWRPVAERLRRPISVRASETSRAAALQTHSSNDALLLGWPGFDGLTEDAAVKALSDLPDYVLRHVDHPVDLVAQSMGGLVAIMVALQRPEMVRRLVLCGTSGGIDLSRFSAAEWRQDYRLDMPEATPPWFVNDRSDLTSRIPSISQPVLLVWGEDDPVSPPAVGRHLLHLLRDARLVTIPGASHMVAEECPDEVARHINEFFSATRG